MLKMKDEKKDYVGGISAIKFKEQVINTVARAKATIDIQYFNRRKVAFEPLLEPFQLAFKYDRVKNDVKDDSVIEVSNWEPEYDPKREIKEQYEYKNAFNINLSTAALETVLEI
mmetsp:Transcript_32915/g.29800  ORF Transcript_32915/g.29800 Transcript_32915/m.29800 type:complete len:114 (-) Transcript_32915:2304-2645(-)